MINEYVCYKCKCDKCKAEWITRTHDVPLRCAKCNSVKWNEFSAPASQQIREDHARRIVEVSQPIQAEPKDELAAFIAKAQAIKGIAPSEIISEPEPIEENWQFTKEKVWYDDLNTPNRRQWLVGSKATFRIVEVGEFDHSIIERIK